jgi:hypothetical protein
MKLGSTTVYFTKGLLFKYAVFKIINKKKRIYLVARVTISQVQTAWITGDRVVIVAIFPKYFMSNTCQKKKKKDRKKKKKSFLRIRKFHAKKKTCAFLAKRIFGINLKKWDTNSSGMHDSSERLAITRCADKIGKIRHQPWQHEFGQEACHFLHFVLLVHNQRMQRGK